MKNDIIFPVIKLNFLSVMILSTFGFYILGPLNVDALFIYGSLVYFLMIFSIRTRIKKNLVITLITLVLTILLITIFSSLLISHNSSLMKIIAGFEDYFRFLAIGISISICYSFCSREKLSQNFKSAIHIFIIFLAVNTLLVFINFFYDIIPFLKIFHGAVSERGTSVAERAAANGRLSGIFNQPMEAGFTYSLAILSITYLLAKKIKVNFISKVAFLLVAIGGMFSISKIYLFVGLPLAILYFYTEKRIVVFSIKNTVYIFLGAIVFGALISQWEGLDRLSKYFTLSKVSNLSDFIILFTAGRFGGEDGGGIVSNFATWMEISPIIGIGFSSEVVDNAYFQYFLQGGFISLIIYISLLLYFLTYSFLKRSLPEGRFLMFVMMLLIVGGMGGPTLALNRFSNALAVVMTCLLFLIKFHKNNKNSNSL